jgi:diaminohydroxyphosphoribosylaminopyrimidine deaminase / 5-amino-6-(5-phosphoribosylamino)uracil reductase
VAAADGSSRWITGEAARADAHGLRAESQAVVVGAGTALADRPTLTVRAVATERQPMRVLLDAVGRVPAAGPLFDPALAATLVATTSAAPEEAVDAWQAAGAKVVVVPAVQGGVDLRAVLGVLGEHQVLQALVEGGPTLHASFVHAGLAGRLVTYVAGVTLGPDGLPMFRGDLPRTLADAPRWRLRDLRRLDDDVRLDFEPRRDGC